MPIPILKQGSILVVSLLSAATDADLSQLEKELATKVGKDRSNGVVIDLTTVDVVNSYATRTLRGIAQCTRLRGAEMVVVGVQPDVAFAMVQLGLTLDGITTALDLEEGLQILHARAREGDRRGI